MIWNRLRERATFANVVALCALFVALGSGAYAALKLEANSVRSKHIVNNQVKPKDVADATFRPVNLVNGWEEVGPPLADPGYALGSDGVVHMRGAVSGAESTGTLAFVLPPAARPARQLSAITKGNSFTTAFALIDVDGTVRLVATDNAGISLENLSFVAK